MEDIRAYLLSVTAVSILCGIAVSVCSFNGTVKSVIRLLTGIILTVTILQPLGSLKINQIENSFQEFYQDGLAAAQHGLDSASEERSQRIKSETEAYILDKAAELGLSVCVSVSLSSDTLEPMAVILQGDVSPYGKVALESIITDQLGIPKEEQIWR